MNLLRPGVCRESVVQIKSLGSESYVKPPPAASESRRASNCRTGRSGDRNLAKPISFRRIGSADDEKTIISQNESGGSGQRSLPEPNHHYFSLFCAESVNVRGRYGSIERQLYCLPVQFPQSSIKQLQSPGYGRGNQTLGGNRSRRWLESLGRLYDRRTPAIRMASGSVVILVLAQLFIAAHHV